MIVMTMRSMCMRAGIAVTVVVMRMVHLVAARVTPMRTQDGDEACDQRADQRQEYKSLDHNWLSPSSD
jgi:hypothetical protein